MPVFALYNFDENFSYHGTDGTLNDSALGNGAQDGYYMWGAESADGKLQLDGEKAFAKILANDTFQMDRGTLQIQFSQQEHVGDGPNTILARDGAGLGDGGGFRVEVLADGAVVISHETATETVSWTTEPGFVGPGDVIDLSYSWDHGGAVPGSLVLTNQTAGAEFTADVPNTLTMDMGGQSPHWFIGAGRANGSPDDGLDGVDQHFKGTAEFFSLSDTVDNRDDEPDENQDPVAVDDFAETDEDTAVIIDVLGNDSDPDGDPLSVIAASALNGTVTINADGTLTYVPNQDYNGPDEISYTISDGQGGTASAVVNMTVHPVNDDPVANPDTATTPMGTPVTLAPLANDTDVDGDVLSIVGTPVAADGTVVVNADGTLTFTPNAGFVGTTSFDYQITDGQGGFATSTVTITVRPLDDDRDGIVRGTDGDDLIDHDYIDPWDGDRVDAGDAIIPGDGPDDDRIVAGPGNDTIYAGRGDDTVWAGPGDDLVYGGPGDDVLYGGQGNDTIHGGDGSDTVHGGPGDDYIDTSGSANPLPDIDYPGFYPADSDPNNDRDLVYGGAGNDTIITGDDADTIYGGMGDDYIDGGIDADLIYAGQGNDTVIGGEGADTIYGGMGDDLIYGGLGPVGGDLLDLPDEWDLRPENNGDLIYGGWGNDTIYGRDDADTIYGGMGDDLVYGGVDNDFIDGGQGNDTLYGEHGDDTIRGGMGDDLIDGGEGNDLLYGGQGNDTIYGGDGDDTIYGEMGDDYIDAGSGSNVVYGGRGNDTIRASSGGDSLYGGADRDLFIVDDAANGIGTFIDGNEGGDDWDTLDLTGAGPLSIVYDDDNPENGTVTFYDGDRNPTGTLRFVNIENVIPCFTPGTLIATPRGEVPVESLQIGDRVITRDNGIQEVRWVGERRMSAADFAMAPHLRPVLIRKGSLGHGLPERDMMVSPNHRVLVANDRTALYFDEHEVLVAAKHLVGTAGVSAVQVAGTSYIHFMCDRHEVVLSDGAWTETFQPGDLTLKGMGNAQRTELLEIFPELRQPEGVAAYAAARKTLKRHEAVLLTR